MNFLIYSFSTSLTVVLPTSHLPNPCSVDCCVCDFIWLLCYDAIAISDSVSSLHKTSLRNLSGVSPYHSATLFLSYVRPSSIS